MRKYCVKALLEPPFQPFVSTESPRVRVVVKRLAGIGGIQVQSRRVCAHLTSRGLPVTMLCHQPPRGKDLSAWAAGFSCEFLPARNQWDFARVIYRHLLTTADSYDLIHVYGLGPEFLAACAARRRLGKPLIAQPCVSGPGSRLSGARRLAGKLPHALTRALRTCWHPPDCWVSLSEQIREDLLGFGIDPARIVMLPNGVDTEQFRPASPDERARLRCELGIGADERVIATACRLVPHKRIDLLIRAFHAVSDQHPYANLWILGEGEHRPSLEALAHSLPISDRIRFLGRVKPQQVVRYLQACDIFTLPSLREGLSCAVQEAMACGLPCVVTEVSGTRELINSGVSGVAIPPDDEPAAVGALAALLADGDLRARMGKAARRHIETTFSLSGTVGRYEALYTAVTRGEAPATLG